MEESETRDGHRAKKCEISHIDAVAGWYRLSSQGKLPISWARFVTRELLLTDYPVPYDFIAKPWIKRISGTPRAHTIGASLRA